MEEKSGGDPRARLGAGPHKKKTPAGPIRSDRAQIPRLHFGREKPTPTKDLPSR